MDFAALLNLLKLDLQLTTTANDEYLTSLLKVAVDLISTEGVRLADDDSQTQMVVVQYATYLFRKRAAPESAMPRFLRYALNNMLFSQKIKSEGARR